MGAYMNKSRKPVDIHSMLADNDHLEYHIKFPTNSQYPQLNPECTEASETDFVFLLDSEYVPIVLLLGWAGCQDRYLVKYSRIYEDRGLITIRYSAPAQTLFWKRSSIKLIGEKILKLLNDMNLDNHPLFFHVFSNGGAFLYQNIVLALKNNKKSLNIQGIIYDSAPGERRLLGLYRAIHAIQKRDHPNNKFVWVSAVFITMTLSIIWILEEAYTAFKSLFFAIEPIQTNPFDDLINENTEYPEMYIYSKADDVIPYYDIEKFASQRSKKGVCVTKVSFEDAEHVKILTKYPQQYISAICSFINGCFNYKKLNKYE